MIGELGSTRSGRSIGLVRAVPLTTALAAWLAERLPASALAGDSGHVHHH